MDPRWETLLPEITRLGAACNGGGNNVLLIVQQRRHNAQCLQSQNAVSGLGLNRNFLFDLENDDIVPRMVKQIERVEKARLAASTSLFGLPFSTASISVPRHNPVRL
jgi:hypothetical protein